jgi:hypothetical protein
MQTGSVLIKDCRLAGKPDAEVPEVEILNPHGANDLNTYQSRLAPEPMFF